MRVFATYNIKGGVGKTATAVNLSYLSARQGYRTLVWDLDPQGAATFYFRIKPKIKGGSKDLLRGKRDIDDLIKGTDYENLDLLPADFSYRNMDLVLDETKKPTHRIRKVLKPLEDEYDHVFLDCPPSISLVSENVFQAADALLVPIIPTTLSLRTLTQLNRFLEHKDLRNITLLPFFSMVDRRKNLHREVVEKLPKERPEILSSPIPNASDVERMGLRREAVAVFAHSSLAAQAYEALWEEIKGRMFKSQFILP
ncbi:MAG: AAA family ATPase [Gammaproteobacteria bacterium]|nr:AAA family ATPase [Gammaproteobacteria bacterium]